MKLTRADLPRLQLALLAALLTIMGGSGAAYLAYDAERRAGVELAAAQKARDEIDGRFKRVRSEEAEIREKSALFNALQARGVIGDEQRLEWLELIKAISVRRRLLDVQYEIAAQRPLDSAPPPAGAYAFYASSMRIELALLHEEDLTRLLDDLRQQAHALIQVRRCRVERLTREGDSEGGSESGAQLRGSCLIDWVTLRRTDTVEAKS